MYTLNDSSVQRRIADAIRRECPPPYQDDLLRCASLFADLVVRMQHAPRPELTRAVQAIVVEHCYVVEGGDWPADEFDGIERATRRIAVHLDRCRRDPQQAGAAEEPAQVFG